ncbi:MAG: choice-of-anchor Q domain-containing protein [Verrucomicrobiia bacterium]
MSLASNSSTNSVNNDYHLQSGSPAIAAGVNLGSLNLPGLNTDKDGNPRPASGPWAIGAYQQ